MLPNSVLPPIGQQLADDDLQGISTYVTDIFSESSKQIAKILPEADENIALYTWNALEEPGEDDVVIPEIQNSVLTGVNVLTREPQQITLEPQETGERPTYYWAGPQDIGVHLFGDPRYVAAWLDPAAGQLMAPLPLDPDLAETLIAQALPRGTAVQPGMLRQEWFVAMDDRLVADVYQTVFDVYYDRCDTEYWYEDALLDNSVEGTSFGLYQFNDDEKTHVLKHIPLPHICIDPTARDISNAAYAGYQEPLDAREALRQFPDRADLIEAEANIGNPVLFDDQSRWSVNYDLDFKRPMIAIRVLWVRNVPCLMTEDEAIASGKVKRQEVPDAPAGPTQAADDPAAAEAVGDDETAVPPLSPDSDVDGGGEPAAGPDGAVEDVSGGEGDPIDSDPLVGSGTEQQPNEYRPDGVSATGGGNDLSAGSVGNRHALIHVESGEEVTPDHEKWPSYLCVAQITQLGSQVIDYKPSEFGNLIPIVHNKNIPMPGARPQGQGEPKRLKSQQEGLNESVTNMVEHGRYFAHPMTIMPESTAKRLPEEYKDGRSRPGLALIVDDAVFNAHGGDLDMIQEPPPMSPAHPQLAAFLQESLQRTGGNQDAMQGRTPSNVRSGYAIELLQGAAMDVISVKGKHSRRMMKRMAMLMVHSLKWRLELGDLAKIIKKYPIHVLDAMHQRVREIDFKIQVAGQAGASQMMGQKLSLAQTLLGDGLISRKRAREMVNVDDRVETERIRAEQIEQARDAALLQVGMAPGAQPGAQQQPAGEPQPGSPSPGGAPAGR